jgi:hypothetical protein
MRWIVALAVALVLCVLLIEVGRTDVAFESAVYGTSAATQPYASTLYIPAVPSSSVSSLVHIPGNLLNLENVQSGSSTGNTLTGASEVFYCTASCTVTPPVPVVGYMYCVADDVATSGVITIANPGSSTQFSTPKAAGTATSYGTATSGTLTSAGAAGDFICILGRDSTHYNTFNYAGTWTAT